MVDAKFYDHRRLDYNPKPIFVGIYLFFFFLVITGVHVKKTETLQALGHS